MILDLARWPEISRLLDEALGLPDAAARAAWLEALSEEHRELKPQLAAILGAEGVFPQEAVSLGSAADFVPGDLVGPFTLQRELGRGGMAVVWLASRAADPHGAPVALKLPYVSLRSSRFLERFAREREFLAALHHPNIARLVEAGVSPQGQQYLALEFVDGLPLIEYCDARALDLTARVHLFAQVARAVGHAHANRIAHRDLKPSNVLVDARGVARLLDFGVAKLLVDGQADETALTEASGRALTPDYASPEQIAGGTVTPASDIYSLGVVLHELVSGARPYRLEASGRAALEQAILTVQPQPPSEAVKAESAIARAEGGHRNLARRLRGGLDAIVVKAMRKKPEERHGSAEELARDLEAEVARGARPLRALWSGAAAFARRNRIVAALAIILWIAMGNMRVAHRLADDLQQLIAPPLQAGQEVALVTINVEDYRRLFDSRSPLDPRTLERLVGAILEGRPATLGVDIDTSDPSFAPLRHSAGGAGNVVWAREAAQASAMAPGAAVAQMIADADDGVTRRYARAVPTSEGTRPSLPWAVAGAARAGPVPHDAEPERSRNIRFTRTERLEFPASVVMAPGFDWKGRLENRVVLLGGRYDRADMHDTPLGRMAGVEVVANAVETELRGGGMQMPGMALFLLIGLAELVAILLLFDHLPFRFALAACLAGTVVVSGVLALVGIFPAWPYAFIAMLVVLMNQLAIETFRLQRKTVKETFHAVRSRWKAPS